MLKLNKAALNYVILALSVSIVLGSRSYFDNWNLLPVHLQMV